MARAARKRSTSRYKTKSGAKSQARLARIDRAYELGIELGAEGYNDGFRTYRKLRSRVAEKGPKRAQTLASGDSEEAKSFRKGLKDGFSSMKNLRELDRKTRGAVFMNPRRRRNSVPESVYQEARSYGLRDRQIRTLARYARGEKEGDYPKKMGQLKRDHAGNAYWPVRTVHDTHWHYTLKKFKPGWVVEFRRRDGQSNRHYITPNNTQSSKKSYYRSKTEAFKALSLHAYKGSYAKFRNPRRRR